MLKDSKILTSLLVTLIGYYFGSYELAAQALFVFYVYNTIAASSSSFVFREFILVLFSLNYLLSPSIVYPYNNSGMLVYNMKCPEDQYFSIAFPATFALQIGMYLIPTKIFNTDFNLLKIQSLISEKVMLNWFTVGIIVNILNVAFISYSQIDLGFVWYLMDKFLYLSMFGLTMVNYKKYKYHIIAVNFISAFQALQTSMFHDFLIWLVLYGLFIFYYFGVKTIVKIVLLVSGFFLTLIIQTVKSDFRSGILGDEKNQIESFVSLSTKAVEDEQSFLSNQNLLKHITRVNQGWIAASTIDNMDNTQGFEGLKLLNLYLEAAFLPRFLAPNKISSGDQEIFNKYSGHTISKTTSMGLGLVADGYIAYAYWGVIAFCFGYGLLLAIIFKIVEHWTLVSPYFFLFVLTILSYGIRPDCELQTALTHMVKSLFFYAIAVQYYKKYFASQAKILEKVELFKQKYKLANLG